LTSKVISNNDLLGQPETTTPLCGVERILTLSHKSKHQINGADFVKC